MSDSKLFVFGSFTEDEIKTFLQKKSSGKEEKPAEEKELHFGSLNFGKGITFGQSGGQHGSSNGKISITPPNPIKDANEKLVGKTDDRELASPKVNGNLDNSTHVTSVGNGVKDFAVKSPNLCSLSLSSHGNGSSNLSLDSHFHVLDGDRTSVEYSLSMRMEKEDIQKASNAPLQVRDFLPRGLINWGNLCFLNATLQALLSCSPFIQLLQETKTRSIPKDGFPVLDAFAQFVTDFIIPSSSTSRKDAAYVETGRPFSPLMFEGVLKNFTPDVPNSISGRPRQEDAQEFLCFILDTMHEELLKLESLVSGFNSLKSSVVASVEEDDWETVGPKNKSAITRTQSFIPSKLSEIFGGQLISEVKARGNKPSNTVQPYLLIHLDIYPEAVHTIEDALHLFSTPESLEGYRTSTTGKAGLVTARKSVKIQKLSKIMILHLMRFSYGSQGTGKLLKPVRFPSEIVLRREMFVSLPNESRKYQLVATITHHGRDPSRGHYTTDAYYPNGQWLRFDDASVNAIGMSKVLHDQAYVLFYKQVE